MVAPRMCWMSRYPSPYDYNHTVRLRTCYYSRSSDGEDDLSVYGIQLRAMTPCRTDLRSTVPPPTGQQPQPANSTDEGNQELECLGKSHPALYSTYCTSIISVIKCGSGREQERHERTTPDREMDDRWLQVRVNTYSR